MQHSFVNGSVAAITVSLLTAIPASAALLFSTGSVTSQIATASRPGPGPGSGANQETESADDFFSAALRVLIPRPLQA